MSFLQAAHPNSPHFLRISIEQNYHVGGLPLLRSGAMPYNMIFVSDFTELGLFG